MAHEGARARYGRVQRALKDRLAELCPDADDASRTTRVPGSLNSKVRQPAAYTIHADAAGVIPSYTLRQLSRLLDVAEPGQRRRETSAATDDRRSAAGLAGYRGRCRLRLDRLLLLERLRGGFKTGTRSYAVVLAERFAADVPGNDLDAAQVARDVADRCDPPLEVQSRSDAGRFAGKMSSGGNKTISGQKIADWLDVSPGEAEELRHRLGGRTPWPAASRFGGRAASEAIAARKPTRAEKASARRQAIRYLLAASGGAVPSTREMAALLDDEGHAATHATVAADYRAMGVARLGAAAAAAWSRGQRPRGSRGKGIPRRSKNVPIHWPKQPLDHPTSRPIGSPPEILP